MLPLPRPATLMQQLAAPKLAELHASYATALLAYEAAPTAQNAHTRALMVRATLTCLNTVLEAVHHEPQPAPKLLSVDELLTKYSLWPVAA